MNTKVAKTDVTKTELAKVEVWARDNYEFYSGGSDNEVKIASFASTEAGINFIKQKLDEYIQAQLKTNLNTDNLSIDDLLAGYRFGGTHYFIKMNQPCGESSVEFDTSFDCKKYVEQQFKIIIDKEY